MLVNYFCGVADRFKALARLAQSARLAGTKRWPGWQAAPVRYKSSARQAGSAPLHRASRRPFPFPYSLVLQVPNMLRLVVDRDRLNLGVM